MGKYEPEKTRILAYFTQGEFVNLGKRFPRGKTVFDIFHSLIFLLGSFLDKYKVFLPNLILCIGFLLSAFSLMLVTRSR